ncbi:ComEA family DNA-binding protein [Winogradskyella sp. A3E31]|uniref:ComEA family DNA-binding protein n=1 Tax=Winogradskyella sp. A3E31 TaxID=3349637 RepID=UPI00398A77EA
MKSHFQFSKQQRSGIFLLLSVIIILLGVLYFIDFSPDEIEADNESLIVFQREIDSLKQVELENRKPKLFPFNPNFITDYKGYTLGMSTEEIDKLLAFRAKDQWVNSAKEFQNVTGVSDSLLSVISPYFKFPDWVTDPKTKYTNSGFSSSNSPKSFEQKIDLNKATASQLIRVYGVGDKLSQRIIDYRDKYKGGFIADVELMEVYGLSPEVIERITNEFTVKTPRPITTFNLNSATRDQLVTIPYIDYEIAARIIEARTLRDGFKSLDELTKVEDFPISKIEIIKLYLQL